MRRARVDGSQPPAAIGTPISCRWPIEKPIVRLKQEYPSWGAPKIRERLRRVSRSARVRRSARCMPCWIVTASSTRRRRRVARALNGTPLSRPLAPERALVRRLQRRIPAHRSPVLLSAHDHRLRDPLSACLRGARRRTKERYAFTVFERAFQDFGLPDAIRTDNGVPFASCAMPSTGSASSSVWWLRLGIASSGLRPGHPEQNGRHERMHLTLKTRSDQAGRANFLQQQIRFDTFVAPLQPRATAPGPRDAAARPTLSRPQPRPYRGLDELEYPFHDWTAIVTTLRAHLLRETQSQPQSRLCRPESRRHARSASTSGSSASWTTILGYFDDRDVPAGTDREPVSTESVTHVSGMNCYLCTRNGPRASGGEEGIRTPGTREVQRFSRPPLSTTQPPLRAPYFTSLSFA